MYQQDDDGLGRWRRRAHQAAALRLGVLCGPVLTSFAAAYGVHRLLPPGIHQLGLGPRLGLQRKRQRWSARWPARPLTRITTGTHAAQVQTAPNAADPTSFVYFASTPLV